MLVVMNGHQKDPCYAQNIGTMLDLILNRIGRAYVIV
jgi:hypothetical protein